MNTTSEQDQFIASLDGDLTPEQAAHLLELGEGDTGGTSDNGGVPGASRDDGAGAGTGENAEQQAGTGAPADGSVNGDGLNSENAVILAKDGKHTISYDKLLEARQGKQQAEATLQATQAQLAEAQAKLDELQRQAQARADAGETATAVDNQAAAAQAAIDAGVDPALFGDFSEADLAKGIQTLVDMRVGAKVQEALAAIDAKLTPIQQERERTAAEEHYGAIYKEHPDADSIYESKELSDWIDAQPSFVRDNYRGVLQAGTTQQVIELFHAFKTGTGGQAATGSAKADPAAAARAALAAAKSEVPGSLSDIPGGRPGAGASREEVLASMESTEMLEAMEDMTPEQIERFLDRRL